MNTSTTATWALRPALPEDIEALAELRATAMRPDLERLGRYDEHRVRRMDAGRLRTGAHLGSGRGRRARRVRHPAPGRQRAAAGELLPLPALHGRGIGTAVLRSLLARADERGATVRLDVLQGSAARALYARHGFTEERQDPIDVFMVRPPVR